MPFEIATAIERRDWKSVESRCRETLASMPATPWAVEALVRALVAQGREGEADTLLLRTLPWAGRESFAAALLRERLVADGELDRLAQLLPEQPLDPEAIEERLLAAVHAHRRQEFERARELARQALLRAPGHAAALNHQARATHNLGRPAEALELFERAVKADPRYAEGWHNLAMSRRLAGKLEGAIEAYLRSIALRPGYRSAALNLGKTLLAFDRPAQALSTLRGWLARAPQDADAWMHEALCLHTLQRLDEALGSYRKAVALDPSHGLAWLYLGMLAGQQGDRAGAGEALQRAVQLMPRDGEAWAALAAWHEMENQLDAMQDALQRGMAAASGHPRLQVEAARLLRRRGQPRQAIDLLRRVPPQALPPPQRAGYWFELGRSFDRAAEPRQAWSAFTEANAIGARAATPLAASFDRVFEPLLHWSRRLTPRQWGAAPGTPRPVFLLGFPRSGITLLNTMLGCHPRLRTLEERPTIESCVQAMAAHPASYPGCLDQLGEAELDLLRERYWSEVQACGAGADGRLLLDMFPLRSIHAAAVARLFPQARVLFVQRDPRDVVLSNFMQEYGMNAANAHFTSIEASVRLYAGAMEIWQQASANLPLQVHALRYEDLVRTPREVLQGILGFLELDWDERVLTGHVERARDVHISTSSYHEVAEPLYDRSIGRWRAYRQMLEPLLPQLEPAVRLFGYGD